MAAQVGSASAVVAVILLASVPAAGWSSPYSEINQAAARDAIVAQHVRGQVTMLEGSGGNIGILSGRDGILMVDAGIAVSRPKIQAALRKLGTDNVRKLIDTHWHWDHTDGNAWVRRSGARVLADANAIRRLQQTIRIPEWEHTFTPVGKPGLPSVAVRGDMRLTMNGETAVIRHYPRSHTDGDLSVYFQRADVLQTGDTFWNGMYPFIGDPTGAGIDGAIRAANVNIALAGPRTLIIPGHGPLGNRADLVAFRDMLVNVRAKVAALKKRGLSLEQIVAARPTASYDAKWGRSVINGRLFTALVYRGV